jgi:hypothetical protein|tara:strand:+ start:31 stop:450 length:420 start_codon:yes stop_codon:yes gene_type:complete
VGDRFYLEQRAKTGYCIGSSIRRKRMAWDEDKKQSAIDMYTGEEATPETSMEIVKVIAEELGESPNGVRMILTRAGVYVKKNPSKSNSSGTTGGGRLSKAACHQMLVEAVTAVGGSLDMNIIDKISGKAAKHIAEQISN